MHQYNTHQCCVCDKYKDNRSIYSVNAALFFKSFKAQHETCLYDTKILTGDIRILKYIKNILII